MLAMRCLCAASQAHPASQWSPHVYRGHGSLLDAGPAGRPPLCLDARHACRSECLLVGKETVDGQEQVGPLRTPLGQEELSSLTALNAKSTGVRQPAASHEPRHGGDCIVAVDHPPCVRQHAVEFRGKSAVAHARRPKIHHHQARGLVALAPAAGRGGGSGAGTRLVCAGCKVVPGVLAQMEEARTVAQRSAPMPQAARSCPSRALRPLRLPSRDPLPALPAHVRAARS